MKNIVFILFPFFSFAQQIQQVSLGAQSIDTLGATAWTNTYMQVSYEGFPWSGTTTQGHIYCVGINNRYDSITGSPLPFELVRTDMTTGVVTTKIVLGSSSSASLLWKFADDSSGTMYFGLNTNNRYILKVNMKDSIWYQNLGNSANDGVSLAYSLALGRNGNMFTGSSSGAGPSWSEIDKTTGVITKHSIIDNDQNYVLTIQGDTSWAYAQVGQSGTITYWAIRKSDDYKKAIATVPDNSRFTVKTYSDGCYFQGNDGKKYSIHDTTSTLVAAYPAGNEIFYFECNDGANFSKQGYPVVNLLYYNQATSQLNWTINTIAGNTHIPSSVVQNSIRRVFADRYDSTVLYYVGDFYGNFYKYNTVTHHTTILGFIGFNTYSWVQYDTNHFYIGGYPSGITVIYDKRLPWTAQTFFGGVLHGTDNLTNPKAVINFRTATEAQFHPNEKMIMTTDSFIVAVGTVIRTQNTASIASYYPATGAAIGYNADKMPENILIYDVAQWRNYVIFSTILPSDSTHCNLYIWNYHNGQMVDSINLGYGNYGMICVIGDKLIGVGNNHIYNYNLAEKKLIKAYDYPLNTISGAYLMPDGRILIKSTIQTLPTDMSLTFIPYTQVIAFNEGNVSGSNIYATPTGQLNIIRLNNYFYLDQNCVTPAGIFALIQRKLNLKQ